MGLDHPDHIFGTILDVYAAAGSTRTNDFIDNSRPCDHIRKLCGSGHNTPKFVTLTVAEPVYTKIYVINVLTVAESSVYKNICNQCTNCSRIQCIQKYM